MEEARAGIAEFLERDNMPAKVPIAGHFRNKGSVPGAFSDAFYDAPE